MTTLVLNKEPLAVDVDFDARHFAVDLADGRRLQVPLEWYPRLLNASKAERRNWRLLGGGYAIEWPDLDEHIGVEAMLAGHASGESKRSIVGWQPARRAKKEATSARREKPPEGRCHDLRGNYQRP
jgi:hypothetical protein